MDTTNTNRKYITVQNLVSATVATVWKYWTGPEHITKWCQASDDWHAPHAENDVRTGGKFKTVMAAKDGTFSFDFGGTYTEVQNLVSLKYSMDDGRKVDILFVDQDGSTEIIETFEMEDINPEEMQRSGWQTILDNFKKYVESHN